MIVALRLWPPVVTNMRVAAKDLVLPKGGGSDGQHPLFVPQGTAVRWSLYSFHRRRDHFGQDADEFRPERWESLRTTCVTYAAPFPSFPTNSSKLIEWPQRLRVRGTAQLNRWEYLPFSGGPRTCIGQQFALTQMSYVVTRLLQTFETVEARDEKPMSQNLSTTTSLLHGCWVGFKPTTSE